MEDKSKMFEFQEGIAAEVSFRLRDAAESPSPEIEMVRKLPSRNVTPDNLTDTYVAFILYCNPQFPANVDTSQLVEKFNSVPKTDNKEFETWRLFELIKQFDAKEIETWGQLALDLGVEPPDTTKQQSIQKVQQYTVRLKRWMRAMHIDAFFEWLLGKEHSYVSNIPASDNPYPSAGRDGVPTEEDLAIRALEPAFRPKRGRRRNSEIDEEEIQARRERRIERSFPEDPDAGYIQTPPTRFGGPWGGVSSLTPQGYGDWPAHLRWGEQEDLTAHPMTAIPGTRSEEAYAREPMSAITPSTRKRRKHGPAVSSAWSSSTPTGAKPRGRPPAVKGAHEGAFTTFPVQRTGDARSPGPTTSQSTDETYRAMPPPSATRPERLSLTVPPRTGAPVRLATPPRVTISESRADSDVETELPTLTFETMKRSLANDLLRADMLGRPSRLSGDEAKGIADSILERMKVPRAEDGNPQTYLVRLTTASWLGLGDQINIPVGPASGLQKKIRVTRYRTDAEGYEQVVPPYEETGENDRQVFDLRWQATQGGCLGSFEISGLTVDPDARRDETTNIHDFIINRVANAAKGVGMTDLDYLAVRGERAHNKYGPTVRAGLEIEGQPDDRIDWKTKFRMMEFGTSLAHGEFDRFKSVMLQKVLDLFL